ncbi:MAG: uroporphyrinogen-III C-methyltransferase, partial [Longimicrobiales bacterium]
MSTVYLVGAGPGDPGLLTLRGAELVRRADVIIHDAAVHPRILEQARADAERIAVGPDCATQEQVDAALIRAAREAEVVVRLKVGDPFVFGRGGEEALVLHDAGVAFEVVPGVTAGIAAPAYAGIPVTQRGLAPAVAFVTGHEDPGKEETQVDWRALAAFPGTLVFY